MPYAVYKLMHFLGIFMLIVFLIGVLIMFGKYLKP